jgi:hypothetical protein
MHTRLVAIAVVAIATAGCSHEPKISARCLEARQLAQTAKTSASAYAANASAQPDRTPIPCLPLGAGPCSGDSYVTNQEKTQALQAAQAEVDRYRSAIENDKDCFSPSERLDSQTFTP